MLLRQRGIDSFFASERICSRCHPDWLCCACTERKGVFSVLKSEFIIDEACHPDCLCCAWAVGVRLMYLKNERVEKGATAPAGMCKKSKRNIDWGCKTEFLWLKQVVTASEPQKAHLHANLSATFNAWGVDLKDVVCSGHIRRHAKSHVSHVALSSCPTNTSRF
eukprot:scaffold102036_cov18-Tisochrysis_lutea.AAC.6